MAGSDVPYQIRINKGVDRNVFIDALFRLFRSPQLGKVERYSYVGFGGYAFEDFKLLHMRLGISRMVSLEEDEKTFGRQVFNKPYSCIELENTCFRDYINDASLPSPCIVWLDYADANERGGQLDEFEACLEKMSAWDVLRITLNANPSTLDNAWKEEYADEDLENLEMQVEFQRELASKAEDPRPKELKSPYERKLLEEKLQRTKRFLVLKNQVAADRIPSQIPKKIGSRDGLVTAKYFPRALYHAVCISAERRLSGTPREFFPLLGLTYKDSGHKMLTVTGIILPRNGNKEAEVPENSREEFLNRCGMADWNLFLGFDGADQFDCGDANLQDIGVPELTVKEKNAIDVLLPQGDLAPEAFKEEIKTKYKLELPEIENYLKFYRYYPSFRQVWL